MKGLRGKILRILLRSNITSVEERKAERRRKEGELGGENID